MGRVDRDLIVNVPIEDSFLDICKEIMERKLSESEWAEIESDDMFQSGRYIGGYDADEGEFCFSYHTPQGDKYWFQISLNSVFEIANGETVVLN